MAERIYLSPPHLEKREKELIIEALDSNWVAPVGPHLDAWEKEICATTGASYCCLLNSATAAIHIALRLLDVGPGDLVFIQSHTHIGSVNPIIYLGATPVFIDSEVDSWNMSPIHLEEAIIGALEGNLSGTEGKKPKAIIPVHLYGMPANMDAIISVANKYNLPIIEDAAESLGSTYGGKQTGTIGDLGVYSFNGNKIITSSGGGALISERKDDIDRAFYLALQARDSATHFQHSEIGYNYRMSNILAAIGRGQMESLSKRVEARRNNHKKYRDFFMNLNALGFDIRFQEEPTGSLSNRWLTCILVSPATNKGLTREALRLAMEKENIESRPLWKPMHMQPVFEHYPYVGKTVCEDMFEIGLCLPSGSSLGNEDFARIFEVLEQCCSEYTT